MDIQILEGTQGAQQAKDIAVVIDVLRAATVSAYLLDAGVRAIIPVVHEGKIVKSTQLRT